MRTFKWLVLGAGLLTASVAGAKNGGNGHGGGHHHGPQNDDECTAYYGPFSSQTGDPCESPIGLCTHGSLEGEFSAQYDFTFETLENANDAADPTKFVYTGYSVITPRDGSGILYSDDTGIIHIPETGLAPFVTKAIVVDGTKKYTNTDGGFVATGNLNFESGLAVGSYSAVICKPKRH